MSEHREVRDKSIAARGARVFDSDQFPVADVSTRSFADFVRETPAAPLSLPEKLGLGGASFLVGLVLLAALRRVIIGG